LHGGIEEKRPSKSLLQSIVQFVQSSMNVKELEHIFQLHVSRAQTRIQGLTAVNQMLKLCSFGSVRHQLLRSLNRPFSDGGHYLDNIQTCGEKLTHAVTEAFCALFDQITNIIRDPNADLTSRLLALNICGMTFHDYDTYLLNKVKIFPLLRQIVSEKPKPLPTTISETTIAVVEKTAIKLASESKTETREKEKDEEKTRSESLVVENRVVDVTA
jgi:hypothetical protein